MSREFAPDPNNLIYAPSNYIGSVGSVFTGQPEDDGPDKLFSMVEQAIPRPDEVFHPTMDEAHRRELVEHTWEQVRRWIWKTTEEEKAAAAKFRGQSDVTPLHLMCKLNNPPMDIISDIVEAAPEVCTWQDSHGWLPLHHACNNGASTEVLQILTAAFPESKVVQDNQNRTPLHFYATRNADNPTSMAANVELLSDTGAAELPDRGGMLPMHYACAYGTRPAVLQVLASAYPDSITATENRGRTPLHLAMVNAGRDTSPGVIQFLLENEGIQTVNMRDDEGNLPLHLLNLGLRSINPDQPGSKENVGECLKLYLAARPEATPDFLTALQDLPEWLQEVAVISPHIRDILNKKIVQRFPSFTLMMDGYMYLAIITCFEIATDYHIDQRFGADLMDIYGDSDRSGALIVLFIGVGYFLLREVMQIISLFSLGTMSSWFKDTTNYIDIAVISLLLHTAILMTDGFDDKGLTKETFRSTAACTKGVLWMAFIYFLKSTLVDFAVFLSGVFYVVQRLVAFLLAIGVILLAFGQMFFILYIGEQQCNNKCEEFPHCSFEQSLLKVYTMMMGEIGDETRYEGYVIAQILYVAYAVLVVILLSNVLIAIVTDSYEIIQNDRAAIVFWSNRLDFVAEMDGISNLVKHRILCMSEEKQGAPGAPKAVQEGPNGTVALDVIDGKGEPPDRFEEFWKSLTDLFVSNFYDDIDLSPSKIEFWVYILYQGFALILIPVWFIIGLATAGILWPPQVRELMFAQKETAISRAEIERAKLQQLRDIQDDIKALKNEIGKEMAGDREDVARMKSEVDAIQTEVISDLQQVKELMTTLLDLGDISQGDR